MTVEAIVIGTSAGGLQALQFILEKLPENFVIPILIVQHISPQADDYWIKSLKKKCKIPVKEAEEKELIQKGTVYIAPPDYHLLVEHDYTLTLSVDEKVNFSRPSIDVLFETASDAYKEKLMGVVLTGASKDGANGLKTIKTKGGITVVQDPEEAEFKLMPLEAIKASDINYVLTLRKITELFIYWTSKGN